MNDIGLEDKSPNDAGKDIGIATIKRYHAVRADCMLYMDYVTTCHNYTLQGTNISPW